MKFWANCQKALKNLREIEKKISNDCRIIIGNTIDNDWSNSKSMLILWRNFRKFFLNNFSKI